MNHLFQLTIATALLLLTACHSKFGHPRENLTQTLLNEQVNMPRHYLFLIHGIGGDDRHFGKMDLALTAALNAQSDTRHLVNSFEYETEDHDKSIYDFAQEFGAYLNRYLTEEGFGPGDKFSLIMHSQGGLVGSVWLMGSLRGDPRYSPQWTNQLDAFVTLATPFWGAKTAQVANRINQKMALVNMVLPLPMGRVQLKEMSFGSDTVYRFRQALVDPAQRRSAEQLSRVRSLNVAGVSEDFDLLAPFGSGSTQYEDDTAVILPSARFGYLYHNATQAEEGSVVVSPIPQQVSVAPFVAVNAMHLAPETATGLYTGIAQIPRRCVSDPDCGHPTLSLLIDHLMGRPVTTTKGKDWTSFLVEVNLRTPANLGLKTEQCTLSFQAEDGIGKLPGEIDIDDELELASSGSYTSDEYSGQLRFYYTGNLSGTKDRAFISIRVACEGLASQVVRIGVEKSWSSYLDLTLSTEIREGAD